MADNQYLVGLATQARIVLDELLVVLGQRCERCGTTENLEYRPYGTLAKVGPICPPCHAIQVEQTIRDHEEYFRAHPTPAPQPRRWYDPRTWANDA